MTKKVEDLAAAMESVRPMLGQMIGVDFNYTPQSLKKLEAALISRFGRNGILEQTSAMLGAYLGETIRRNIKGAEWVDFEKYVDEAHLMVPTKAYDGGAQVNPFIRIQKFMSDHTDSIYSFYCMIQDMANGRLNIDGATEGESPRGYSYKVTTVSKELHERYERGEISKDQMMDMAQAESETND